MKKLVFSLIGILGVGVFIGTAVFLYKKSEKVPVVFKTDTPYYANIIKKTVATGEIIPRREVDIKSQVSGVVDEIFVEAGSVIKKGDLITRIRIIPDVQRLNAAESQLETANINLRNAKKELKRQEQLYKEKLIPESEYNRFVLDYNLRQAAVESAERNLSIVKEGASEQLGEASNLVTATLDGMVLDVGVKEGTFIRESNNFNAGTTIANVANMSDMIFEGAVDESEVSKIKVGMELLLSIGAMESEPFTAVLEYISPKGYTEDGTIKFEIRAAVSLREDKFIRAGYSANADIVLDKREDVLAIDEALLQFEGDKIFVEVETTPQAFDKRFVEVGLSDGINIEVLSGVTKTDKIKKPI